MNCNDTSPKAIGERIKSARENCKMTQKELAKKLICTRELISYYENGSRDIKTDTLIRLSEILGVTTDYLLGLSRAETKDITVASICDYTGLSEKSVKKIDAWNNTDDFRRFWSEHLSRIIEADNSENLFLYISKVLEFSKSEAKALNFNDALLSLDMGTAQLWYASKTFTDIIEEMCKEERLKAIKDGVNNG